VVTLMNLTDIELGHNLGYMRENTYNVTSDASNAHITLSPDDNSVVVTAELI